MKTDTITPKVTVIIPIYNYGGFIGRAIRSVQNQTYQNLEIIVVDDGSTDNTENIVKQFQNRRLTYIRHIENKGRNAARNTGILSSAGDYIAFLDSITLYKTPCFIYRRMSF